MEIHKKAHAKINLYLKISDKRPDGYHGIYTVMQKISLSDEIIIDIFPGSGRGINISCDNSNIPADKTNTACRAADLFFLSAGIKNTGADIHIEKKIPAKAGLGGGSSDAASVLLGLNEYYDFILSETDLLKIGAKIGADVPFFVKNTPCALCRGIGEIVSPRKTDLSEKFCLIVKPVYDISAKQAYEDWDKYIKPAAAQKKWSNDFSGLIFSQNKNIAEIYGMLKNFAAAELCGSGSAVFGIFDDLKTAKKNKDLINLRNDVEFCDIFDFLS